MDKSIKIKPESSRGVGQDLLQRQVRKAASLLTGRRAKRNRWLGLGLVLGDLILIAAVVGFIIWFPDTGSTNQALSNAPASSNVINPIDQLASATIALTVARMDNLPEAIPIMNQADSETALLTMQPADNNVMPKPQVVATDYISNRDIRTYVVQPGETVASIAAKFNITQDSILWSNNIIGNSLSPGMKLLIPPVTGIVYTVKSGDTPASLAQKFQANESLIIAYNDAEIKGIYPGERILIPNGVNPNYYNYSGASYGWGYQAIYGYNGYDPGNCTWWVAYKRALAGRPLPVDLGNASTWGIRAEEFGLPVGTTPEVGAAVVMSTYADYGLGHVAYVTGVNPDGTITISEMNYYGPYIVDTRTVPGFGYLYIY